MTTRLQTRYTAFGLALAVAVSGPVQAGNEFVGGLVGGVIGGIIGSQIGQQQRKQTAPRKTSGGTKKAAPARPALTAEQREEQRRIQVALNAMGCDVGNPDGVFGGKTRNGIRCFQAKVEQPQTGTLTPTERQVLLERYASLQSGGGAVAAGVGAGALFATLGAQAAAPLAPVSPTPAVPVPAAPDPVAAAPTATVMANALVEDDSADATTICEGTASSAAVALPGLSSAVTTAPVFVGDIPAVGFCDLRAALIARADESVQSLGVAKADAAAQCQALGDLLAAETDAIGVRSPADVIAAASATIGPAVSDYDAAVTSSRLCAGIAYGNDDVTLAEAIALFGAAVGDPSLAEAVGWHLSFGLGRDVDRPAAAAWLREAADQMAEIDPSLLLMADIDRRANLLAVAEVMDPQVKPVGFVLPGLKN